MQQNFEPINFNMESTSVWSFKERGTWATHTGDYRGNCPPQVPRNLILKYTNENDIVLDPFCGSGTSMIECKLLKRKAIGIDINEKALKITSSRLNFNYNNEYIPKLIKADSINLQKIIRSNKIDFIFAHPPYADIIKYSNDIKEDISRLNITEFLGHINLFSKECFRMLKDGKFCALLIGDIRKQGNVIPLGFYLMNIFIKTGFQLKEIIIKEQHNCKMTDYWKNKDINFYLLAHEYIFVFKKLHNLT